MLHRCLPNEVMEWGRGHWEGLKNSCVSSDACSMAQFLCNMGLSSVPPFDDQEEVLPVSAIVRIKPECVNGHSSGS